MLKKRVFVQVTRKEKALEANRKVLLRTEDDYVTMDIPDDQENKKERMNEDEI